MSVIELKRKIDWETIKEGDVLEINSCFYYEDLPQEQKDDLDTIVLPKPTDVEKEVYDNPFGWQRVFFRGFETDVDGVKYILYTFCNMENKIKVPNDIYRKKFRKIDLAPEGTYTCEDGILKYFIN
jgi:hypothetical protein